jgi:hypothetical protein
MNCELESLGKEWLQHPLHLSSGRDGMLRLRLNNRCESNQQRYGNQMVSSLNVGPHGHPSNHRK